MVSSSNLSSIKHVVFMLQENHSFDNYFQRMLNPYTARTMASTSEMTATNTTSTASTTS